MTDIELSLRSSFNTVLHNAATNHDHDGQNNDGRRPHHDGHKNDHFKMESTVLWPSLLWPSWFMPQYVVSLSVCLSVTFRSRDHIGWNTSKIISRPNSLRFLLGLTQTWAIWCNGNGVPEFTDNNSTCLLYTSPSPRD